MGIQFIQNLIDIIRKKDKRQNYLIYIDEKGEEHFNPQVKGLKVLFLGEQSLVKVYTKKFNNCKIVCTSNNYVEIKQTKHCINNLITPIPMSKHSKLFIDEDLFCASIKIFLCDEENKTITIGKDCMFSFDVVLWASDGHSIYDTNSLKILNKPLFGITIGNHCWISRNVSILKDVSVPDNVIIGCGSIVTNSTKKLENTVMGGGSS